MVDDIAWKAALEIMSDSSKADEKINALRSEDPTQEQRPRYASRLTEIERKQKRLRDRLEDEDLDAETYQDCKLRLKRLAEEKVGYEDELNRSKNIHEKWEELEQRLNN